MAEIQTHNTVNTFTVHQISQQYSNTSFRQILFRLFLCRFLPATFASAKQAGLQRHPQSDNKNHKQKADDIQTVVLNPVQVMRSHSQMWRSLVSYYKLSPENSQVQRLNRTVQVDLGQLHHPFLITEENKNVLLIF